MERSRQARISPDDFAQYCFRDASGRPLRQSTLHRELQAFLVQHRHALIELPRDHGKSVQACLRILWELGHNPSLRVQIVCASDELAAERARFLRQHLMHNSRLRHVFPHLRPGKPWTRQRFNILRPASGIAPSVSAVGIGAATLGSRADLLVCDDVVDVKALRSSTERNRVKMLFQENLMNQLEPDGRFWGLFTPWHRDDLNAMLKNNSAYSLFRRPIDEQLTPIWPEQWSRQRLADRRQEIGALAFARGYRLQYLSVEEAMLKPAWIRLWTDDSAQPAGYERVLLSVDPAVSTRASADCTALVTLGLSRTNEIHVLESLARRVAAPDLVTLIADAVTRHHPDVILFEANAAFAGIRDLLIRHASFGPRIHSVTQSRDKLSRIHAFSVPVENGTFRLKGHVGQVDPSQQALFDEMVTFPIGEHDDLLDAAATGTAWLLDRREPRVW